MQYFGGIEGGTTGSRMVIMDINGGIVGKSEGPHTNYWHLGMKEAANRIIKLTKTALADAELPVDTKLRTLGLALSGVNTEENEQEITTAVREEKSNIADKINATNDAVGTLLTAIDGNAIVLIAGTGSICKLIRKNLSYIRIGGLGYLLGDEGSAFWIAHQAIMAYMKITEGLYPPQYNMKKVTEAIYMHFQIKHHHELLAHFHDQIDKKFIALLCKKLSEAAYEGDLFCRSLFHDAGLHLGRHLLAAARHAEKEGIMSSDGIDVICCGSVFKSWELLESGLRDGLKPQDSSDIFHGRLRLRLLQVTAAIGAAIMAARIEDDTILPRPTSTTRFLCEMSLVGADDSFRDP